MYSMQSDAITVNRTSNRTISRTISRTSNRTSKTPGINTYDAVLPRHMGTGTTKTSKRSTNTCDVCTTIHPSQLLTTKHKGTGTGTTGSRIVGDIDDTRETTNSIPEQVASRIIISSSTLHWTDVVLGTSALQRKISYKTFFYKKN